ncbi:DUF2971 domain-containing protein [Paenibacillus sp. KN14-4R]|uniref:DUF2971 domain-containing protein n=1 Tax=Paenibacillus sp. KN14-4R TaxID=3445773 RepID=UPI003FA0CD21
MNNYTFQDWKLRIASRIDITGMVTHLTKPKNYSKDMTEDEINKTSIDTLIKILSEQRIVGSTTQSGFICGNIPAVCFQEVPLYSLAQNVEYEKQNRILGKTNKIRYCGNGLAFSKFYIYDRSGRPVIYEKREAAQEFLPENQFWRIVNLNISVDDPKIIDWTHEREWRIPNELIFELDIVHVILYDKVSLDYFNKACPNEIKEKIYGITILKSIFM